MGLLTLEGIYRDGKVELSERPESVGEATRVLVTFLPAPTPVSDPGTDQGVDRETLRARAFARMKQGLDLGGPPYPSREQIHSRLPDEPQIP